MGTATGLMAAMLVVPAMAGPYAFGQTASPTASSFDGPTPQLKLPTPTPITPNGQVVEDIIARVNDQIIDRTDLERAEQQLVQEGQQAGMSSTELADRQKDLLRDLIDNQLLLSKGKDSGINADAEVIRQLDEIRKQNHLDTLDDLEKAVRSQGISYEDFKANIRNNIVRQQVVRDEVGRRLQLNPNEEQAYYEAHKNEYSQPEQIRLSEILVPTPADASADAVAQAQAKADGIEKQLKAGDKFDELAKAVSGGPTAAQGGDLGLFKRGGLAKVLEDQTFDLKAGEFTQPIRTRQGFVILKVTQHDAAGVPPLSAIEPQIQEAMYNAAMQPALRAYLTKLREDSFVEIAPGLVDTGASSKQTKPVFTAYTAPVSKKAKKAKAKKRFDRGTAFSTVAAEPKQAKAKPTVLKLDKNGKPKKVKREKIRFGQAPEQTLPPGPTQTATGTDSGVGASQAAGAGATLAPGTAIAPVEASSITSSSGDDSPLAAKPVPAGKLRYADKAPQIKLRKAKVAKAKANDKLAATPTPITSEEKAAQQVQSAPLGLGGDTAKKVKQKRKKGDKKKRLEAKPKAAAPQPDTNGLYPTPYHGPTDATPATTPAPAPTTPAPSTTTPPASPNN